MASSAAALASHLRRDGRKGDTIVAHINPREAAMLLRAGGSGSRNPKDGLPEFFDEGEGGGSFGGNGGQDMGMGSMGGTMGGGMGQGSLASLAQNPGLGYSAPPLGFGAAQPGLDMSNPFATAPSVPYNAPPPTAPVTMSGPERDLMIRTAYGEDPNNPGAIASVINNRYQDANSGQGFGQYGNTLTSQITAPAQFNGSPSDPTYGARARALDPNSQTYGDIGKAVDGVMSGSTPDVTSGATSFFAPNAVRTPSWAQGQPFETIGTQQFYGGTPSMKSLTAATQGDPFTKAVYAAVSQQAPSVNGMPGGLGYGDANSPSFARLPANGGQMERDQFAQGITPNAQASPRLSAQAYAPQQTSDNPLSSLSNIAPPPQQARAYDPLSSVQAPSSPSQSILDPTFSAPVNQAVPSINELSDAAKMSLFGTINPSSRDINNYRLGVTPGASRTSAFPGYGPTSTYSSPIGTGAAADPFSASYAAPAPTASPASYPTGIMPTGYPVSSNGSDYLSSSNWQGAPSAPAKPQMSAAQAPPSQNYSYSDAQTPGVGVQSGSGFLGGTPMAEQKAASTPVGFDQSMLAPPEPVSRHIASYDPLSSVGRAPVPSRIAPSPKVAVKTDAQGNALDPNTGLPTATYYNPKTGLVTPPGAPQPQQTSRLSYSAAPSSVNPYAPPQPSPQPTPSWAGSLAGIYPSQFGQPSPAPSAPLSSVAAATPSPEPAAPLTVPAAQPAAPTPPAASAPSTLSKILSGALRAPGDALSAVKAKAAELSPAVSMAAALSALKHLSPSPGTYSPSSKGGNPGAQQMAQAAPTAAAPAPAAAQFQLNPDGSIPISWPLSQVQAYYASLGLPA